MSHAMLMYPLTRKQSCIIIQLVDFSPSASPLEKDNFKELHVEFVIFESNDKT